MTDRSIYTTDGVVSIVRHMRMMRDFLAYEFKREEERLLVLLEAAKEFDAPVDAHGKRWKPDLPKKQYKPVEISAYLLQALRSGEMASSEGIG